MSNASARDSITQVARDNGWEADWYGSAIEFSRGWDRVNVVFDRALRVTWAMMSTENTSDSVDPRTSDKRGTVTRWLESASL